MFSSERDIGREIEVEREKSRETVKNRRKS